MDVQMRSNFKKLTVLFFIFASCAASYHEQYRVPQESTDRWESYVFKRREYIIQNLPVSWENAKILCGGHHNGTLAILDTREKAEFFAEALSESKFVSEIDAIWVGARRESAEDPAGYRWDHGGEVRRTELDVLSTEDEYPGRHFPLWLNRTRVPVPEGGADCVALERVKHDRPVFLDLPCDLLRPFACERESKQQVKVTELKTVRCKTGLYRIFEGGMEWKQAASYCLLRDMTLANIATSACLKKLGTAMLKTRPSIENAWIGARGSLGNWSWVDSGLSIFHTNALSDTADWPPMRDRSSIKQTGCLQIDRHASHSPVFMEARCDRKMQFICQQGSPAARQSEPPSDDNYYYILVRQLLFWQHAYDNCLRMNGSLAAVDSRDVLLQMMLIMGEDKELPVNHIWVSGRLNMSRDATTDTVTYAWYNPFNGRRVPDRSYGDSIGLYVPPWLDEDYSMGSPCLNLDRQDHLTALVYGLPCDTPQYSVCLIEKLAKRASANTVEDGLDQTTPGLINY